MVRPTGGRPIRADHSCLEHPGQTPGTVRHHDAREAMEALDIVPIIKPIRGGTDGSQLSFMGLPCPNIFAGGHNFHGKYEYVPVESMQKAVDVIVKICELTAKEYSKN